MSALMLGSAAHTPARTSALIDPEAKWATVIIESARSRTRDEALCQGSDALRFFDALRLRAEAGADVSLKEVRRSGIGFKCENATGMGFVSCSLNFSASPQVTIDPESTTLRGVWVGLEAKELSRIWERSCAGASYQTEDSKFRIAWSDERVEMIYSLSAEP